MHWKRMLLWSSRLLADDRVRTDLVKLLPFEIQIALSGDAADVNDFDFADVVTDWMNDSFAKKALTQPTISNMTTFETVVLDRVDRRRLGEPSTTITSTTSTTQQRDLQSAYTAKFTGVSLWERRGEIPPINPEVVELIQRATFLEDQRLLIALRAEDDSTGLGSAVIDVRAGVITMSDDDSDNNAGTGGSNSDNLEVIIIIAIVVACLAFCLLAFAVCWAWRTDRSKRQNYKSERPSRLRSPDGTGSESDYDPNSKKNSSPARLPQEITPQESHGGVYPESVISEDISTSLTAYYKSGMAGYSVTGNSVSYPTGNDRRGNHARDLNDGASMSSMDSYGYSLDGYAPSLSGGTTQLGYPIDMPNSPPGPVNGQVKDPNEGMSQAATENTDS